MGAAAQIDQVACYSTVTASGRLLQHSYSIRPPITAQLQHQAACYSTQFHGIRLNSYRIVTLKSLSVSLRAGGASTAAVGRAHRPVRNLPLQNLS